MIESAQNLWEGITQLLNKYSYAVIFADKQYIYFTQSVHTQRKAQSSGWDRVRVRTLWKVVATGMTVRAG